MFLNVRVTVAHWFHPGAPSHPLPGPFPQVFELQQDRLLKTSCIPRFARIYQSCAKHGSEQQLQVGAPPLPSLTSCQQLISGVAKH